MNEIKLFFGFGLRFGWVGFNYLFSGFGESKWVVLLETQVR